MQSILMTEDFASKLDQKQLMSRYMNLEGCFFTYHFQISDTWEVKNISQLDRQIQRNRLIQRRSIHLGINKETMARMWKELTFGLRHLEKKFKCSAILWLGFTTLCTHSHI